MAVQTITEYQMFIDGAWAAASSATRADVDHATRYGLAGSVWTRDVFKATVVGEPQP